MKFTKIMFVVFLLAFVFVLPVLAAPQAQAADPAGPEELATYLLALSGIFLSAVFKYVPKWKTWFDNLKNKGLVMLGFVAVIGLIYFGLSCTPYAVTLGITIACETASWVLILQAIWYIFIGNQAAYLVLPSKE